MFKWLFCIDDQISERIDTELGERFEAIQGCEINIIHAIIGERIDQDEFQMG